VSIDLSTSNDECALGVVSATLDSGNWQNGVQVTVTAVDDIVADGAQTCVVQTAAASSSDGHYNTLDPGDVTVTVNDDDSPGLRVSAVSGNTTEAGGTVTLSLALFTEPTAPVTVTLASSDPGEGTVLPAEMRFTAGNWSTPQTATVTGVDDDLDDDNQAYAIQIESQSQDPQYDHIATDEVSLVNVDDDTAGIAVSAPAGSTTEGGGQVTFTVRLNSEPAAPVTVTLASLDAGEGIVSPAQLVFTPANWAAPQMATITGQPDGVADGDQTYTIAVQAASRADNKYDRLDPGDISLTNTDNAPALSDVDDQQTEAGTAIEIAFTVSDVDTALDSLSLSGSSSDTALVPNANIRFGGMGVDRTVTIAPMGGITGTVTITILVSDGESTNSDSFVLTVNARTECIIYLPVVVRHLGPTRPPTTPRVKTSAGGW
jgi:hypothetical protein